MDRQVRLLATAAAVACGTIPLFLARLDMALYGAIQVATLICGSFKFRNADSVVVFGWIASMAAASLYHDNVLPFMGIGLPFSLAVKKTKSPQIVGNLSALILLPVYCVFATHIALTPFMAIIAVFVFAAVCAQRLELLLAVQFLASVYLLSQNSTEIAVSYVVTTVYQYSVALEVFC